MIVGKDKNKCHHVVIHKICVYSVHVGVSNVSSPVDFYLISDILLQSCSPAAPLISSSLSTLVSSDSHSL